MYIGLILCSTIAIAQVSGDFDDSFDTDGFSSVNFNDFDNDFSAMVIQNDHKIVGLGTIYQGPGNGDDFGLCRLNADGSLDTSFATNGIQLDTDIPDGQGHAIVLQPDGKIIAVGSSSPFGGAQRIAIARYNTDGSLDTTFSEDGKRLISLSNSITARSVKLQDDGKIIISGTRRSSSNYKILLLRLNADGSSDTSFNGNGIIEIDVISPVREYAEKLLIQPDGKYIIGGIIDDPNEDYNDKDIFLLRLNTDGTLDTTFNTDGKLVLDIYNADYFGDIALQSDGSIILSGSSDLEYDSSIDARVMLTKIDTNGNIDTSFATNGLFLESIIDTSDALSEYTNNLLIAPDDAIYIGGEYGTTFSFSSRKGYVARFNADGSRDMSFSDNGVVLLQSTINIVNSIKFDNNQKLIIGGTDTYADNSFRFARVFVEESLSIETLKGTNEPLLHPNPVNNELNLTIKNPKSLNSKIELLDINGRIIQSLYQGKLETTHQFDIETLNSGFYILQIQTIEGTHAIKFLKK
jgi:uncharacterized delta-60 repeat protein